MKSLAKGVIFTLLLIALGSFLDGKQAGLPPDQLAASVLLVPLLALGAAVVFLILIAWGLMVVGHWPKPEDRDEQERFERDFPERKE